MKRSATNFLTCIVLIIKSSTMIVRITMHSVIQFLLRLVLHAASKYLLFNIRCYATRCATTNNRVNLRFNIQRYCLISRKLIRITRVVNIVKRTDEVSHVRYYRYKCHVGIDFTSDERHQLNAIVTYV